MNNADHQLAAMLRQIDQLANALAAFRTEWRQLVTRNNQ